MLYIVLQLWQQKMNSIVHRFFLNDLYFSQILKPCNLYFPEYPAHTPLTRVIDGGEPSEFISLFKSWRDKDATTKVSIYQDCKSFLPTFIDTNTPKINLLNKVARFS